VIWVTRIGGTLAFGKEAMGLGDVHLMAAVGAVCGWRVAVLTFFIAPFIGLGYTVAAQGAARLLKREVKRHPLWPASRGGVGAGDGLPRTGDVPVGRGDGAVRTVKSARFALTQPAETWYIHQMHGRMP
jgi:hypothetical protein